MVKAGNGKRRKNLEIKDAGKELAGLGKQRAPSVAPRVRCLRMWKAGKGKTGGSFRRNARDTFGVAAGVYPRTMQAACIAEPYSP